MPTLFDLLPGYLPMPYAGHGAGLRARIVHPGAAVNPPRQPSVPAAGFESYYGRPVIKEPAWKTPDVPLYVFLGGLAGASSVLAAAADLTGRPGLARAGAGMEIAASEIMMRRLGLPAEPTLGARPGN